MDIDSPPPQPSTTGELLVSVRDIAANTKKLVKNVKRDLESLAEREPTFPLHLWKAQELDNLGRPFASYNIPVSEALFFASAYGYKYAKELWKTFKPGSEAKLAEVLRINNQQADTIAEFRRSEKDRKAVQASYADEALKWKERHDMQVELIDAIRSEFPQTADRIAELGRGIADVYNDPNRFRPDFRESVMGAIRREFESDIDEVSEQAEALGINLRVLQSPGGVLTIGGPKPAKELLLE